MTEIEKLTHETKLQIKELTRIELLDFLGKNNFMFKEKKDNYDIYKLTIQFEQINIYIKVNNNVSDTEILKNDTTEILKNDIEIEIQYICMSNYEWKNSYHEITLLDNFEYIKSYILNFIQKTILLKYGIEL